MVKEKKNWKIKIIRDVYLSHKWIQTNFYCSQITVFLLSWYLMFNECDLWYRTVQRHGVIIKRNEWTYYVTLSSACETPHRMNVIRSKYYIQLCIFNSFFLSPYIKPSTFNADKGLLWQMRYCPYCNSGGYCN